MAFQKFNKAESYEPVKVEDLRDDETQKRFVASLANVKPAEPKK